MININKSYEFFDPASAPHAHILGCGAIGSTIAVQLARLGMNHIHLWDFDIVESVNIANQQFIDDMVGMPKVPATDQLMHAINPDIITYLHGKYTDEPLDGIVFIAVDNVDVRKEIIKRNRYNPNCQAFIDIRMRLTDAQLYSAYFNSQTSIDNLLKTLDFTQEEAMASTPVSACGTTLSVIPTVQTISAYAVANMITHVHDKKPKYSMILMDTFNGAFDVFYSK